MIHGRRRLAALSVADAGSTVAAARGWSGRACERSGGVTESRKAHTDGEGPRPVALRRALNLPLLTLYGLGVTIGAGIYVLVGAAASHAGLYAPVSFLLAALVVAFTGFSYAELGVRFPVSAGAAAYVRHGLRSHAISIAVGAMVMTSGVVSAAAISIGAAGYLAYFVDLPLPVLTALVILLMGMAAAWGIVESVTMAAVCTLIEIVGLILVIHFAISLRPELLGELDRIVPPFSAEAWSGIAAAGLLAFFAFVGFEDIANVAEEVRDPRRTMPRAILATLLIATALYVCVVTVVTLALPLDRLSGSAAPLALIFDHAGGFASIAFLAIAVFATVTGVLVQMIMSSRVLYGLAAQGSLPSWLGPNLLSHVSPLTRTPLVATAIVVGLIALLALAFPIAGLAETTARIVLAVFVVVNLALVCLKLRREPEPRPAFEVPLWVPVLGMLSCLLLLGADLWPRLWRGLTKQEGGRFAPLRPPVLSFRSIEARRRRAGCAGRPPPAPRSRWRRRCGNAAPARRPSPAPPRRPRSRAGR